MQTSSTNRKSTANHPQVVQQIHIKIQKPTTDSQHSVKMLYNLLYDLLSDISTTNRNGGL